MDDTFDITLLNPDQTIFMRSSGGMLTMAHKGTSYSEVHLYRAFPLSKWSEYISVRTPKGDEIGILAELAALDEASRGEVERELLHSYMVPEVTGIDKIKENPGMWVWHVQTTMGPAYISMPNLHEHVQTIAPGRLLLSNQDGDRWEIPDLQALDKHSQKQMSNIM